MRPVKSLKHVIDVQGGTVADTKNNIDLVQGVADLTVQGTTQVSSGSKVFGLFLNIQAYVVSGAALNNMYFIIYKNPGANVSAADIPKANVVGASDFRRQVFHQEMLMLGDIDNIIPVTLFKGVIKVPRTFQTIRENDKITIQLFTPAGITTFFCIQCIYKSFE